MLHGRFRRAEGKGNATMAREQTHTTHKGKSAASRGGTQQAHKGKEGGKAGKESNVRSPAKIQKFLGGLDYPVQKQQLVERAREEGADREVLALIERLPDREYDSPVGVSREIGKLSSHS
jgi:hypothetical protein